MKRDYASERPPKSRRPKNFKDDMLNYRYRRKHPVGPKFDIDQGPDDPQYEKMWYVNPDYRFRSENLFHTIT